jgi:hypothetical protein
MMMLAALADPVLSWEHLTAAFAGATAMGLVGHAVNTFPTPVNPYGQWFLGVIKFAVGQRISAMNAFKGQDTVVASVPRGMGTGTAQASEETHTHTNVTPETITNVTEKVAKTEVTIPNPNPGGTPNALPPQVPDK